MGSSSGGVQDMGEKKSGGKQCLNNPLDSPVSVNSNSSNHDTLLIHTMELEALAAAEKVKENLSVPSLAYDMGNQIAAFDAGNGSLRKSYAYSVKSSIKVTELEGPFSVVDDSIVEYSVQSPDSAHDCCDEVIPTPPVLHENTLRFSARTMLTNLERVEDKAKAASKKKDLEGLLKGED